MSEINIYNEYGFKFFECHFDKSPKNNPIDKYLLSAEDAIKIQKNGGMIGAIIPKGIVCINLNKSKISPDLDGVQKFKKIKEKYKIDYNYFDNTFFVKTRSGGFHIFFKTDCPEKIINGMKDNGVEIKKSGYVIAAGTANYEILIENKISDIDKKTLKWITETPTNKKEIRLDKPFPLKHLCQILNKIDKENIKKEDIIYFINSCMIVSGNTDSVMIELSKFYSRITGDSIDKSAMLLAELKMKDGITINSFIKYLKKFKISAHMIKKATMHDSIMKAIITNESTQRPLPFETPNYNEIVKIPSVSEFFDTQGHTKAADILQSALTGKVIYVEDEKQYYFFGDGRWEMLQDFYSTAFLILATIAKVYYQNNCENQDNGKKYEIDTERFYTTLKVIENTHWKQQVLKEFSKRDSINRYTVQWDSPELAETLTTSNGVIEFKDGIIRERDGKQDEYRRSYVDYHIDEIMEAKTPKHFIAFLKEIFPDEENYEMAKYVLGMCISGNAGRRLFHLWEGDGANGKSTLIEIIKDALGKNKAASYPAKLLLRKKYDNDSSGTTPELHKFRGKYFMFGTEAHEDTIFESSVVKELTGGDTIHVNPKYGQAYDMEPTWQLILAVNDLPAFSGLDSAFVERLLILSFNAKFCKTQEDIEHHVQNGMDRKFLKLSKDRIKLVQDIMKEKTGIIKFMIDNYIDLENEHKGKIPQSDKSQAKKRTYVESNDNFTDFVDVNCVLGDEYKIFYKDLSDAYQAYFNDFKIKTNTITKGICKKFTKRGVQKSSLKNYDTGKQTRCLIGIGLKSEYEQENINEEIEKPQWAED